ncbi:MAG TPA: hypothetical protein VER98_15800 [Terriglobia bacterium]|nr:hypothetical protein [Terriglobia bacterium]
MVKRLLIWVLFGAGFFVAIQYLPAYFYASEFDDFVKDEMKFAPTRESTDKEHLTAHITDASAHYGVHIDPKGITVTKTYNADSNLRTLTVSVAYTIPVDLYYFTPQLRRQVTASVSY